MAGRCWHPHQRCCTRAQARRPRARARRGCRRPAKGCKATDQAAPWVDCGAGEHVNGPERKAHLHRRGEGAHHPPAAPSGARRGRLDHPFSKAPHSPLEPTSKHADPINYKSLPYNLYIETEPRPHGVCILDATPRCSLRAAARVLRTSRPSWVGATSRDAGADSTDSALSRDCLPDGRLCAWPGRLGQ